MRRVSHFVSLPSGRVGAPGRAGADRLGQVCREAVDDRRDPLLGIMADDGVLEDALAGAGFAEDEAEPALVAVDLEDVEVALLVFEQGGVLVDGEGALAEAEVAFDHGGWLLGLRFADRRVRNEVDNGTDTLSQQWVPPSAKMPIAELT